jgi:glutamine cyclotransferase
MKRSLIVIMLFLSLVTLLGPAAAQDDNPLTAEVALLKPEVISTRTHDTGAYTQGLLFYDGVLYESAGKYGESTLRQVDPETGEVLQSISISEEYFAEGLERVEDTLIQLTWKEGVAFVYDLEAFEQIDTFEYEGEGWGLCSDGEYLFMSDGSSFLDIRDLQTFDLIFSGMVTLQGSPVIQINELECVGDYIYANIYQTDFLVKIDKTNGVVVAVIDASGLLSSEETESLESGEVLNGIANNPETDTLLIKGKRWPKMFEVRFVESE